MINLFTYGFGAGARSPSRTTAGRCIKNRADQPHFIEFQQVKAGTTAVQVKQLHRQGRCRGSPSWALKAS